MIERITLIGLGTPEAFNRASVALEACRTDPPGEWKKGGIVMFTVGPSVHIKRTKTGWTISCTSREDCSEAKP